MMIKIKQKILNVRTVRTFNKASFISFSFLGGGKPTKDLFMNS